MVAIDFYTGTGYELVERIESDGRGPETMTDGEHALIVAGGFIAPVLAVAAGVTTTVFASSIPRK